MNTKCMHTVLTANKQINARIFQCRPYVHFLGLVKIRMTTSASIASIIKYLIEGKSIQIKTLLLQE